MKLLKFYADWCNPCKQQGKILEDLDNIIIESINVDEDYTIDIVDKYNVRSLPTLIILNDKNEVISKFIGLTELKEIKQSLEEYEKQSNN